MPSLLARPVEADLLHGRRLDCCCWRRGGAAAAGDHVAAAASQAELHCSAGASGAAAAAQNCGAMLAGLRRGARGPGAGARRRGRATASSSVWFVGCSTRCLLLQGCVRWCELEAGGQGASSHAAKSAAVKHKLQPPCVARLMRCAAASYRGGGSSAVGPAWRSALQLRPPRNPKALSNAAARLPAPRSVSSISAGRRWARRRRRQREASGWGASHELLQISAAWQPHVYLCNSKLTEAAASAFTVVYTIT